MNDTLERMLKSINSTLPGMAGSCMTRCGRGVAVGWGKCGVYFYLLFILAMEVILFRRFGCQNMIIYINNLMTPSDRKLKKFKRRRDSEGVSKFYPAAAARQGGLSSDPAASIKGAN